MKYVIFDLDGTIIDPKEGITKSIQYALQKLGKPVPIVEELLWCIGPPLYESFPILTGNSDKEYTYKAVDLYREYYLVQGIYQFLLYDGITDLLTGLIEMNYKLFIATSKPHLMAKKIIDKLDFTKYFSGIYGCELDGTRSKKSDLLKYLLISENISFSDAIMVGDRKHDIIGAKANNIFSCGAAYGYGSIEELELAGADHIISKPKDLFKIKSIINSRN